MDALDKDYAEGIFNNCEPPCLSLYQPTHRRHPENQQDKIRYLNLVKSLEESLLQKYPKREILPLLAPFMALADQRNFWKHTFDGLAVLGAKDMFKVYRLQRPVSELAVVADSFHTKPLIRILQSADRYQVLGLTRQAIRLFEGNRDALDEIELGPDVPRTITEALGDELTEPHRTVASYGGVGGSSIPMQHGHGGKETEVDIDTERFFRAVDRAILKHHSRPSGLPLILATLPEHRQLFRQVSQSQFLMDDGIDIHPDSLTIEELSRRIWQIEEPDYLARLAALVDEYGAARSKDIGHDNLKEVAGAIVAGRVGTLLIEAEREIPGRINSKTGEVQFDDLENSEVDDVLDDMGELALKMGGKVVIVPKERMPTTTGIAAIYRY